MHGWPEAADPIVYRIRVKGGVDQQLAISLGMGPVEVDENTSQESILVGPMLDQASLIGVLNTLYDYGFFILSVESQ